MQHVFYLLLRRLRTPIITIIVVYAISILGFSLIPGQDNQGNPWHMDFFHAFYFVSFMGSTIGFGEIPFPFTAGQRAWTILTIYASVISWLYGIGTIFALFQDSNYQRLIKRTNFTRRVARIYEPFYLICGYGITGNRLVHQLDSLGIRTVVIDKNQRLIDELEADQIVLSVPALCADASDPNVLNIAGIQNKLCIGVLALTNDDHANLQIAIDSKLVSPKRMVISRTQSKETTANLGSFGTDYIIDPFIIFADHLLLTLQAPYKHLIHDLIVNPHHRALAVPDQNTTGRWVICGYGRFGQALEEEFRKHAIEMTFIDVDLEQRNAPEGTILGLGTEADTLREAGIENAVGIIAGTPDDANNLSIIITARDIKPDLITVVRQNSGANKPIFRAADVNMIMEPGHIIANEIFMLIRTPLLIDFFGLVREYDEDWARALFLRITNTLNDELMSAWTFSITATGSPAVFAFLERREEVKLAYLCRDPRDREQSLATIPLLIKRGNTCIMLPDLTIPLQPDDQVLFCGQKKAKTFMEWIVSNHNTLRYIKTGKEGPDGSLWRWLSKYKEQRQ
ncbi:MAG: NAD-binding protein [Pseudomonadales bacterium]|nr:NAD-binding protein [Pseudomonadales bacterium]